MPSSPTAPKTSRLVGPIPKCSALAHQCLNLSGVIFIWLPFPWPILCNSGSISVEPHGSFQTSRLKKLGLIFLLNGYLHFPISAQLPYCPPFVSLSLFSFLFTFLHSAIPNILCLIIIAFIDHYSLLEVWPVCSLCHLQIIWHLFWWRLLFPKQIFSSNQFADLGPTIGQNAFQFSDPIVPANM